ncbi:MAG: choice-of-anchor B family protein [Phycisphaerales bacterium]
MKYAARLDRIAGSAITLGCLGVIGFTTAARADEDDKKYLRTPPFIGPIVRYNQLPPGGAGPDGTFPMQNVNLATWIPLSNFPGFAGATQTLAADIWGYTSPSGREYALIGVGWGTGVVEVTNPASPVILAVVPGANSQWHDTAVVGNYAYTVSEGGQGIQVINLSQVDAGIVTHVGNVMQGGHSSTHTLLQNAASGHVYVCGANLGGGGLLPVSTANPNAPVFSGPGWTDTYVHEAWIETYTSGPYAGKEIAFLFIGGSGLAFVDVTNKNAPIELYQSPTGTNGPYPGENYSHQGFLSADKKYLYHNDEIDGPSGSNPVPAMLTRVFNIENLANPRLTAVFTNGLLAVDHNEYVHNGYLYQSNYQSGMRVWDLSEPLSPVEVAYLDTYPSNNSNGYGGNWGNYPFFASGTIVMSDRQNGLFVLKVSLLKLNPAATPAALTPGQATPVTVQVSAKDAQVNPASVRMHVSVNGGSFSPIAMSSAGGGAYTASIPTKSCNDRVRYYFSADTTDAVPRTFTAPLTAPAAFYSATAQSGQTTVFSDNFQSDTGWTVANTAVTAGAWARAVPAANGGQGSAIGDADGSGMAYVTGNGANEDLDGGPTRLLSPLFDLSGAPEAVVTYSRWVISVIGTTDTLVTEVSNNNGTTWTQVESLGPSSGGWQPKSFRVADYVAPTAQVRVRYSISDTGTPASQTEAGIDAFSITSPDCGSTCYADCNESGNLTVADFGCFQGKYVLGDLYADCNASGTLTVADFGCFQGQYVLGCP